MLCQMGRDRENWGDRRPGPVAALVLPWTPAGVAGLRPLPAFSTPSPSERLTQPCSASCVLHLISHQSLHPPCWPLSLARLISAPGPFHVLFLLPGRPSRSLFILLPVKAPFLERLFLTPRSHPRKVLAVKTFHSDLEAFFTCHHFQSHIYL